MLPLVNGRMSLTTPYSLEWRPLPRAGSSDQDLVAAGSAPVEAITPVVVEAMAELAGLFGQCRLVIQSAAGHYPWLDDPQAFVRAVEGPPPPHPSHARGGAREGAGDTGGR